MKCSLGSSNFLEEISVVFCSIFYCSVLFYILLCIFIYCCIIQYTLYYILFCILFYIVFYWIVYILLFFSVSLPWSLRKAFLSLLAILWNSAFKYDTYVIGCGGRCYLNLEKSAVIFKTTIECPITILICILLCTSLYLGKFSVPQIYMGGPDVFVIFLSHVFFGHMFWLVVTQCLTS